MARESFSSKIKEQLRAEDIRKKCCQHTFANVMALERSTDEDRSVPLLEIYRKCRCESCSALYARALFLLFGSVTDPAKSYHLDFVFQSELERDSIQTLLEECGFSFHAALRAGKFILYLKDSAAIEDFLMYIGAHTAAFDLMNKKIEREFRNSVNRQVNCDTANIEKQLASAKKYIEAIRYLIDSGSMDRLSPELKTTAFLRIENEQLNLSDLGQLVNPPVSKSGVKHRLEKILAFADDEKQKKAKIQ